MAVLKHIIVCKLSILDWKNSNHLTVQSAGTVEYADHIPAGGKDTHTSVLDMTENNLTESLYPWICEECG